MKKILCMSLCVVLLLCTTAAAQALTNEDIIGTWYLNEISNGGVSMDPSIMAMDMTMEIAEDGTLSIQNTVYGTTAFIWTIEGDTLRTSLAEKPDSVTLYRLEDGNLLGEQGDMGLVFGRERIIKENYQPGAIVASAALTDFCGIWEAAHMAYQELVIPFAMTGMTLELTIGEDSAAMTETKNGTAVTLHYAMALDGGTLTLTDANTPDHEFAVLPLKRLNDGYLCYESEQGNIYFKPGAAPTDSSAK